MTMKYMLKKSIRRNLRKKIAFHERERFSEKIEGRGMGNDVELDEIREIDNVEYLWDVLESDKAEFVKREAVRKVISLQYKEKLEESFFGEEGVSVRLSYDGYDVDFIAKIILDYPEVEKKFYTVERQRTLEHLETLIYHRHIPLGLKLSAINRLVAILHDESSD